MTGPVPTTLFTVLASAVASWSLVAILLPLLRTRLPDRPNQRSAHRRSIPRGGGVAFVVVSCLWGWPPVPLICLPLALVGLLDDRLNLPAGVRYSVQLATAWGLVRVAAVTIPPGWMGGVLLTLALVGVTALINFVNFTDGLDGLVAGCGVVMFATAALTPGGGWLWPLVGALVGFLLWNWSPATLFMGDVGSTFLGAVFAGSVLQQPSPAQAVGLLLVGFPLLADAGVCVVRRLLAGQAVFQAHREHLYQRLQRAGWSHPAVALLYISATVVMAAAYGSGQVWWTVSGGLAVLTSGIWLDQHAAIPFKDSEFL